MVAPAMVTLIIRVGIVTIKTIKLPPGTMKTFLQGLGKVLRAAGVKSKSIPVLKFKPGIVVMKITGTKAELKAAALVVTTYIATYDTLLGESVAKITREKKKPVAAKQKVTRKKRYVLTSKQKAALKKSGYVYITRNKKQIKITR